MCIIVYKPTGIENPSWATLHNCFDYNSDGAGFMYAENNRVYIEKGFMSWTAFKKAFKPFKNRTDLPIVMHFRITTHGTTTKELCHPFPLSSNKSELRATKTIADIGIAHNGCISLTSKCGTDMSDTSEFIRKYANIIITSPKWYENVNSNKLLAEVINSKMLVLSNDGHGEVVGTGWIEEDGVMYSNSSFKSYKYNRYYAYANSYNDDYLYDGFEPTWCKFWKDGKPSKECYECYTYDYCWRRRVI